MEPRNKNIYAGSTIEVVGHGQTRAMPNQITITFSAKTGDITEDNFYVDILSAGEEFKDALRSWTTENGGFVEIVSYTLEKESADELLSVRIEVAVTTTSIEKIDDIIKVGEKYGQFNSLKTLFDFTDAKEKEEKAKALKMAIESAEENINSLCQVTGVKVSSVSSMKITNLISKTDGYSPDVINTISLYAGGKHVMMQPVDTVADILVTYLVEEE